MDRVENKNKTGKILSGLIAVILITIVSAILSVSITKVSPVKVSGDSMLPTLENEELLLYSKGASAERFDVVIAEKEDGALIVKRVIGLPGDDVAVIDGELYINKEKYTETYLSSIYSEVFESEAFRVTLGEGEYFLMGDNRDNSKDSRDTGPILEEHILGVVTTAFNTKTKKQKPIGDNFQKEVVEDVEEGGDGE